MLFIGKSLTETTQRANEAIKQMVEWSHSSAITFDPSKTEIMHFSRKQNGSSPAVLHNSKVCTAEASMRWLGVLLDRKLSFKAHITYWRQKGSNMANLLRSLSNTISGIAPAAVRHAVFTVIVPIMLYGTEAWLTDDPTPSMKGSSLHLSQTQLNAIQKCLNTACKAILPVWRTTPNIYLWKEAGVPAAEDQIKATRVRISLRIATLDDQHPLRIRLANLHHRIRFEINPAASRNVAQRYIRLFRLSRIQEDMDSIPLIPRRFSDNIHTILNSASKEEETQVHLSWLRTNPDGLIVYSDGSKLEDNKAGYGYIVYRNGTEIDRGSRQLGFREVFDAEISGALRGLRQAIKHCTPNTPITVCIDNSSVVRGIGGTAPMSSRAEFLAFQAIRDEFPGRISVRWTPGHKDIPGNEAADALAKKGAAGPLRDLAPSITQRRREIRALLPRLFRTCSQNSISPDDNSDISSLHGLTTAISPCTISASITTTLH
ncbi:hypothetical protein VHEMI08257 [[Torrubiella] hemipterigena]|uniref:RNase H type-1 domain-containing protein n=1 Tax=[Torrubiella] hemipterigena TaxID=1531966 RepID=A0A0A1TN56_9HYPO|nr:hypothetical protein VHEMI08257 [[Torrubiella] hemipterigena]CEJ92619.1 hypothetical protein VHEMI08257 [[Torrubiella] hemipterigena]